MPFVSCLIVCLKCHLYICSAKFVTVEGLIGIKGTAYLMKYMPFLSSLQVCRSYSNILRPYSKLTSALCTRIIKIAEKPIAVRVIPQNIHLKNTPWKSWEVGRLRMSRPSTFTNSLHNPCSCNHLANLVGPQCPFCFVYLHEAIQAPSLPKKVSRWVCFRN
jgi:hypothetical protein